MTGRPRAAGTGAAGGAAEARLDRTATAAPENAVLDLNGQVKNNTRGFESLVKEHRPPWPSGIFPSSVVRRARRLRCAAITPTTQLSSVSPGESLSWPGDRRSPADDRRSPERGRGAAGEVADRGGTGLLAVPGSADDL